MKLDDAKKLAGDLYARASKIPGYNDFSFASWLLCLSDPEKWGADVLTNVDRATGALDDVNYFNGIFSDTDHEAEATEIAVGVYDLYEVFPFEK